MSGADAERLEDLRFLMWRSNSRLERSGSTPAAQPECRRTKREIE